MFSANFNFADVALSLPTETLESYLKNDRNLVHITGHGGQTALHKATYVGNYVVANILLKNGADPNFPTYTGDTSIHIACSRGSLKLLATFLNYKGNLSSPNKNGHLPIHCAAQCGNIVIIQYLSEVWNSNLEEPDAKGITVLHYACSGGHLNLVRFLLEVKRLFCLNTDDNGNTVLHSAALGGISGVCWSVVTHGGESLLTSKNREGLKPVQVAQNSLNVSHDCKKWLEKWTKEYEGRKKISVPRLRWFLLLLTPFVVFHSAVITSVLVFPEKQWGLGVTGFGILLFIMKSQPHRISHPSRWANPIFLGAYLGGLASTITSFLFFYQEKFSVPPVLYGFSLSIIVILLYFVYYLIRKDPGKIPPSHFIKDSLIKLAEDRLEGRFCPQCFVTAPELSHHCRLCDRCVLHLDHHCLFLNTCIGANNHWHFVVFLIINLVMMACYITIVLIYSMNFKPEIDWVTKAASVMLKHDIWTFLLLICNAGSLAWGSALLRNQYRVIGSLQTTFNRMKKGSTAAHFTTMQQLSNFLNFLYNKKVTLKTASHYFKV